VVSILKSLVKVFKLVFSRDIHKRCDCYIEMSYVACRCRQRNLLPICFQFASNLLPTGFQSASNRLPIRFQSASNPLPICFQSASNLLPIKLQRIRTSKFHTEAAPYSRNQVLDVICAANRRSPPTLLSVAQNAVKIKKRSIFFCFHYHHRFLIHLVYT
jgi:hypothetical protein